MHLQVLLAMGLLLLRGQLSLSGTAGSLEPSCFNPLFQVHWAGKSDIRHLVSVPAKQSDLSLCPVYSTLPACCPPSFEVEMKKAFRRWVTHWKNKAKHIEDFQTDMTRVKVSQAYVHADIAERNLFDKALESFQDVFKTYGTCFDTLLEFMAGMMCFTCDPNWRAKVFLDDPGKHVVHLRIHESTHVDLWNSCRALGAAAVQMQTRITDSQLTKTVATRFEDLSMFSSKIQVSEYMANHALRVLRGPNQLVLEAKPGVSIPKRRISASKRKNLNASQFIYAVRDGRASGFTCRVFPRVPMSLSSSTIRIGGQCWDIILILCFEFGALKLQTSLFHS